MERISIPFFCSLDGKSFSVVFSKDNPNAKFRILEVKETSTQETTASQNKSQVLNSNSLDWSGFHCPYCNHGKNEEGTFVCCGTCNRLVCGGTQRNVTESIKTFACFCGGSGRVRGFIENYTASQMEEILSLPASNENLQQLTDAQ